MAENTVAVHHAQEEVLAALAEIRDYKVVVLVLRLWPAVYGTGAGAGAQVGQQIVTSAGGGVLGLFGFGGDY